MQVSKMLFEYNRLGYYNAEPKLPGRDQELFRRLFNPINELIRDNEQGVWYDPSDFSTMFQDAAGTTPVTAMEQPVGLILDKSKGLVLGPELIVNSAWTTSTGWSVDTSTGVATAIAATGFIRNNGTGGSKLIAGKWYQATIRLVSYVSGSVGYPYDGTGFTSIPTTPGTYTYRFLCDESNVWAYVYGMAFTGVVDNISIRELPGNHATQATTASRPVLSALVNLLTYTEQFDNAAWPKTNITLTPNATTAPDGTLTADLFAATTNTNAYYYRAVSLANGTYTYSIYVKKFGVDGTFNFYLNDATYSQARVTMTFTGGVLSLSPVLTGNVFSAGSATATNIGNGWYRVALTATITNGTGPAVALTCDTGRDGYSGIYIWGADLRAANDGVGIPAYQRVTTSTDYDTAGFPMYLRFDGVDDYLSTGSIDFTATDKMTVLAGVRKLSDAATFGVVAELSDAMPTNAGSFAFYAPGSTAGTYAIGVRGTTLQSWGDETAYTAPLTNVNSYSLALSGANRSAQIAPKVNASTVTLVRGFDSASIGGVFGNYPLYIGRRGGTSLPFNGRLYGLVIRGALSDANQIANAERFMNSKTGAY